jgi:hypothetical protein
MIVPIRACSTRSLHVLLFAFLLALPSSLFAQTPDPRVVEFEPSADHSRQVNGVDLVDRYSLEFYATGTNVLLQSIDLGKPSPDLDGVIRFEFASRLGIWQVLGVVYEARVVAVGPWGSSRSSNSNQFNFPGAAPPPPPGQVCHFVLTPPSIVLTTSGTSGSFIVSTAAGCNWQAESSAGWLAVTGGASGVGTGTISYSVPANASSAERLATIRVGTSTFAVSQHGGCTFSLSPTSQGFNPPGGTGTVRITAPAGCTWTAVRAGSWLTILSGGTGNGSGTLTYRVSANTGSNRRTGTLTIAGQAITITQSAATSPNAPVGLRIVR